MHYSKRYKSRGLTLIEVIASIGLLSTLLVMVLSVHARHVRQINLAFEKQVANNLMDGLLAGWFSNEERFPVDTTGGFAESPDYFWRARELPSTANNPAWQPKTIRVEIVSAKSNKVLTHVEMIDSVEEAAQIDPDVTSNDPEAS